MTTDFRALCAEMAAAWDSYSYADAGDATDRMTQIVNEARATLAVPEQGPSEAELKTFACKWWHSFGFVKDKATCGWVIDSVAPEHFADFSRDVLARWGRPAVEPVLVAERLPGPEDCNEQGRCWWLDRPFKNGPAAWMLRRPDDGLLIPFIAWAPHWALPLPQEGADG